MRGKGQGVVQRGGEGGGDWGGFVGGGGGGEESAKSKCCINIYMQTVVHVHIYMNMNPRTYTFASVCAKTRKQNGIEAESTMTNKMKVTR